MKKLRYLITSIVLLFTQLSAQNFIVETIQPDAFAIVANNTKATICTDKNDDWLVQKSAFFLQSDIEKITGKQLGLINSITATDNNLIIVGTTQSAFIQQLIKSKKLIITDIINKWESYKIVVVDKPFKGIEKALVIIGSDKRGVAYGTFEVSKQMGVSPWYWWADVPVKTKKEVFVKKGSYTYDSPKVKYRGIFINDEAPAFSGWTKEKFGGVNHKMYENMFELLLRLKANYLWPAMWGNAFNDDDTLNPIMANKYGIVMGTSHHEPMLRAQQEWKRYGKGAWNFQTNDTVLKNFWRKGIVNMKDHESIVTIGMRGDGDEPMTQGTATALLEKIVAEQRKILEDVTGKKASEIPQLWALYKEVQAYYDKGMRVPDDVTLLLCDDNWGNIRKLPILNEKKRKGGYGIYYHFDYVGDPRNYKWINTNNIARVWEQMHLAYEYGVDKIWIVNVGDLKPMEFPISFFLDYAWDPTKINPDNLNNYYTTWATQQFGKEHAVEIGDLIKTYSQYVARRKPELINDSTFSLFNYNEFTRVVKEYNELELAAEKINNQLSDNYKDAFFELVLHPIKAMSNLDQMYLNAAKNKYYVNEWRSHGNEYADKVKEYYLKDSLISNYYNHRLLNGKWNHMMDQTHIGYTYWQQPEKNKMPNVKYLTASDDVREMIAPPTQSSPKIPTLMNNGFVERNGYVSIESSHFTKAINNNSIQWKIIPDIGKTGDGVTVFPVTAFAQVLNKNTPHLEFELTTYDSGKVSVNVYLSPTLDFQHKGGLNYAISMDDEAPQIINMYEGYNETLWRKWVADNIIIKTSNHQLLQAGKHIIKFWMIDPGVVLQKIVLDFGGLKPSYLGPEETINK